MKLQILVRLKSGVLDVQGKAVEHGLENLGFAGVEGVRIGKLIELDVDADDFDTAKAKADEMCTKLLCNPIIENYEVKEVR
jgi:phosphoribosylformylglycinamidine synthase